MIEVPETPVVAVSATTNGAPVQTGSRRVARLRLQRRLLQLLVRCWPVLTSDVLLPCPFGYPVGCIRR